MTEEDEIVDLASGLEPDRRVVVGRFGGPDRRGQDRRLIALHIEDDGTEPFAPEPLAVTLLAPFDARRVAAALLRAADQLEREEGQK